MTFGVDEYEQAIARIFDTKGNVIGTGFLVAPGYVLTCAHVVLQAIGVQKEKFAEYQGQPQDSITLDFHVLASGQSIQADVVAWLPYNIEKGDVAALRLRSPAPEGATPIPLVKVTRSEVEQDEHSVYGFGKGANGGRSDAYRPKANVAGGRFQLCKVGDSTDETIKPGFSGAPVWNESRECVVGMVATAVIAKDEQQSTAYAIPTKELEPVLKQIDALSLHDLLQQGLNSCESDESRNALRRSIETTFQRCNPNDGDRLWQDQLLYMATDQPPVTGWEAESRLIYFAVMLANMKGAPIQVYDQLKTWVECHNVHFPDLLDRFTRDMKPQEVTVSNACEHLIVTIERVETSESDQNFRVSVWAIANLESYSPDHPRPENYLVRGEIQTLQALPQRIRELIRFKLGQVNPIIHLFLPRNLFEKGIEVLPSGRRRRTILGGEYACVLRMNPSSFPRIENNQFYRDDWQQKWNQLEETVEEATASVFQEIDCQQPENDIFDALESIYAALLKNCSDVGEWLDMVSEEWALPVALWSRDPQYQDNLEDVLDCIVQLLPDRVRQERDSSHQARNINTLGHHLSLVWEHPRVVPPNEQIDPEAC